MTARARTRVAWPRLRLLPATIVAMSLLLLVKTVSLARDAAGEPAGASPGAPSAAMPLATTATPVPPASDTAAPSAAMPASAAPANGQAMAQPDPVSAPERALLLDLRRRRESLDERAAALEIREQAQAAADAKLAARVAELAALQARLETLESSRAQHASENWGGLVHVYEDMKPRDAATIFDALDMQVLLQVLDRMQERRAAPILAAMQPDRARLATQLLAEMRLRATAVPGQAGAPPPDPHS